MITNPTAETRRCTHVVCPCVRFHCVFVLVQLGVTYKPLPVDYSRLKPEGASDFRHPPRLSAPLFHSSRVPHGPSLSPILRKRRYELGQGLAKPRHCVTLLPLIISWPLAFSSSQLIGVVSSSVDFFFDLPKYAGPLTERFVDATYVNYGRPNRTFWGICPNIYAGPP